MVVFEVPVNGCNPVTIVLGRRGTYNTQEVTFDLSYLVENYGAGTAALMVKRSQDTSAYPAVVSQEDNILTWIVSDVDTYYPGSGECQLMWYVDGGLAKTIIYPMVVMRDILSTTEEPPDGYENWIEHLTDLGAETQQNAQEAKQSATEAKSSEDSAAESAQRAEDAAGLLVDVSATATTLDPGQPATAEYNDGVFEFGIPKGDKLTYADLTEADKEDLVQGPIKDAQDDAVEAVGTAKTTAVGAVNQAGTTNKNAVTQEGTTQVNTVREAGTTQVGRVTTEGNTQVGRVQDKGDEVIASIPSDYSDLADDVADLTRQISDETTGLDTKAPVILETASGAIASFDDGADSMPIKKLVAQIEPVQDLHGYDYPWPAGGGVNKLDPTTMVAHTASFYGLTVTISNDGMVNMAGTWTGPTSGAGRAIDVPNAIRSYNVKSFEPTNKITARWQAGEDVIVFDSTNMTNGNTYNLNVGIVIYEGSTAPTEWSPYSNLCPISGWTGAEISRTGMNVWDEQRESGDINISTGAKRANSARIRSVNYIPVKPNTEYYVKTGYRASTVVCFYDGDKNYLYTGQGSGWNELTSDSKFTTPSWCHYVMFYWISTAYNNDVSINYPATDIEYHPYTGNQISVTFPSEAGTVYGATITLNPDRTGTLVVDHKIWTENGTAAWGRNTSGSFYVWQQFVRDEASQDANDGCVCNYAIVEANFDRLAAWSNKGNNTVTLSKKFGEIYPDVASLKAAFSQTPFQLMYKLSAPITYQLTETEVSGILTTLYGTNNFWSDVGDTEVTYPADTKLYIDNKITQAIANALNS